MIEFWKVKKEQVNKSNSDEKLNFETFFYIKKLCVKNKLKIIPKSPPLKLKKIKK